MSINGNLANGRASPVPIFTEEQVAAIRRPSTGISVLVVGAGTAGAFAALECWRKGHEVRIIEKAPGPYTMGDAYSIGPNAVKAFRNWPGMPEENDRLAHDPWLMQTKLSGEVISPPAPFFDPNDPNGPPRIHRHFRPKFQAMLLRYVTMAGIQIEWDRRVVDYFEDAASKRGGVVLDDEVQIEADLIIAADGVGTKSYKIVTGAEAPTTRSSGYAIYRTAYPTELVAADPVVVKRFPGEGDGHSVMEMWNSVGVHGSVWRTDDLTSWSITHKDVGTAEESWSTMVPHEKVLEFVNSIPEWPEERTRLIKTAPDRGITDFKLVWRDPQPNWVSPEGRIVQIGDAAHTFLPTSGSGATQGIEDAVSLAACLQIGGRSNVPHSVRVHNMLRRDRVDCAQLMGVVSESHRHNFDSKTSSVDIEQLKKAKRYGKWIWNHDAEKYAEDNYAKASLHLANNLNTSFCNTNIPPGYTCKPWTISDLIDRPDAGEKFILDGDWS